VREVAAVVRRFERFMYLHVFSWPADGNLPVPGLE
jgi:hypothetical protein